MRDPGNVILRRALRVALLVPVTYYVVQVLLGLTNASLASAFACFSMLALADLGGPRRERFFANAILGCIGSRWLLSDRSSGSGGGRSSSQP